MLETFNNNNMDNNPTLVLKKIDHGHLPIFFSIRKYIFLGTEKDIEGKDGLKWPRRLEKELQYFNRAIGTEKYILGSSTASQITYNHVAEIIV